MVNSSNLEGEKIDHNRWLTSEEEKTETVDEALLVIDLLRRASNKTVFQFRKKMKLVAMNDLTGL